MMALVDPMHGTPDRHRTRWGVCAQRDFRLLWIGETVSGLGNSVTVVALPLMAVVVLDANSTAVGVITAAVCDVPCLCRMPEADQGGRA
ncbi:hypothetical protein [Streptomyces sp. NPDC046821]|uniref:hypothetical protein n=1 Tax=Streptomyces sp. NPDC046821 TaxID=3154702 RepID=UPI0033EA96EE